MLRPRVGLGDIEPGEEAVEVGAGEGPLEPARDLPAANAARRIL
jgi:hypothetical protein